MMYTILAIFAAIVGVFVVGAAVFTAWYVTLYTKQRRAGTGGRPVSGPTSESEKSGPVDGPGQGAAAAATHSYLLRWTVFDYALLLLSACGLLFLFVDLLAVIRDHDRYPYYHYGYLLCGFVFMLIGTLFLFIRLSLSLRMARGHISFAPNDQYKPDQAKEPE